MRWARCLVVIGATAMAGELATQRCPKPTEFANVFSFGYAGDPMPKEAARFGELLAKLTAGGFNTVHCTYSDARLALCRKHGMRMMVDLLAPAHHVYKTVEATEALCTKLRGEPAVWGYNIWNESFGKQGAGRARDILNVRRWDPTHPAYCGTYRVQGLRHLVAADVLGYYDYHWKRNPDYHFPHLLRFWDAAAKHNSVFYRWLATDSGLAGKGNYNRSLYTVNTSIACGLKGALWFIGSRLMDPTTLEWTALGRDILKVNREFMPLSREILRIGNPAAVYSTPITKTNKDRALPDGKPSRMPPGLDGHAVPKDFPIQPVRGEFVMSVFKGKTATALFVANHNCYAEQAVTLELAQPLRVHLFDRGKGEWRPLQVTGQSITFRLDPAGGELLRLDR